MGKNHVNASVLETIKNELPSTKTLPHLSPRSPSLLGTVDPPLNYIYFPARSFHLLDPSDRRFIENFSIFYNFIIHNNLIDQFN